MRLDAYYYSFEPTGIEALDRVLSAVAWAGKASHSTEAWTDDVSWFTAPHGDGLRGDCPRQWIQEAAQDAAARIAELEARVARMQRQLHAAVLALPPRPMCRDCADHDGTCQSQGIEPCDPYDALAVRIDALKTQVAAWKHRCDRKGTP